MVYTGTKTLEYISIPILTIFKNITIILIAYLEYLFLNQRINNMIWISFILIVLSSIMGGYGDTLTVTIQSNLFIGYTWMFFNCCSTAFFTVYMKYKLKSVQFKDFDTVYFNNVLAIPLLLLLSLMNERDQAKIVYQKYFLDSNMDSEFYVLLWSIIISSISTFAISFSSAWCVRINGPTTYSMVGALNKIPLALLGMMLFNTSINSIGIIGLILGILDDIIVRIIRWSLF
ncbi:hypothetical protein BC833DRAFT_577911 [Globomyces pollinis-pini]|nr:hypothetical protein BC833DRAFT_577911 [Globomyces pollinis-pini]